MKDQVFQTARARPRKNITVEAYPEVLVTTESFQIEVTSGEIKFKTRVKY